MRMLVLGLLVGAAIGWVNHQSFVDEMAEQELYCKMVSEGKWYDSAERYSKICFSGPGG